MCYADEFYLGVRLTVTKHIKRLLGQAQRYKPENVHWKRITSKDTKAKAREEDTLKIIHLYVIIGYNYQRIIQYTVPNKVRKMTTSCYIEQILLALLDDFCSQGLTLCYDADSAHLSSATKAWVKENNLKVLPLLGVLPNISIFESTAQSLKRRFYRIACASEAAAVRRFEKVFLKEMSQEIIQHMYDRYPRRLEALKRADRQMTKY